MADEDILLRLKMQGGAAVKAEVLGVESAIRKMSDASVESSRSFDRSSRSAFTHRQALYTLRRGIYATTIAFVGLGAVAVRTGFNFNATMEQSQIAMAQFLGGTNAARKELALLFNVAAQTPFTFANITTAATQFLGFGFSIKETNRLLTVLGDTVAGLPNLGAEGVQRLAIVFGQIRASGRLLGQDLLQLTQAGIPAIDILRRQLGLKPSQVQALLAGTLRIPASTALEAITRGLQQRYQGLAAKQAQTFSGLRSTLSDYTSQLLGAATRPAFLQTEKFMRTRLNPLVQQLTAAFQRGGMEAAIRTLDHGVGASGRLVIAWHQLRDIGVGFGRVLRGAVIPALALVFAMIGPGSAAFGVLAGIIGVLGRHTTLLKVALAGLLVYLIAAKVATLLLGVASLVTGRNMALVARTNIAAAASSMAVYSGEARLAAASSAALTGRMLALRALGVISIGIALNWIIPKPPKVPGQIKGPPGFIRGLPVIGKLAGWGAYLGDELSRRMGVGPRQHLASGGRLTSGGSVVVGENGPEMLHLPRGAAVQPLGRGGPLDAGALTIVLEPAPVTLNLDGRVLAQSTISLVTAKMARA